MQTFDEWIAQHYPMFELTGDREEDTTARLVRIVALDLFNQRDDLLEGLQAVDNAYCCGHDMSIVIDQVRAAITKAEGGQHDPT